MSDKKTKYGIEDTRDLSAYRQVIFYRRKDRIVIEGLQKERHIAELCRRKGINATFTIVGARFSRGRQKAIKRRKASIGGVLQLKTRMLS